MHKFRNLLPEDPNYAGSDSENFDTNYKTYAGEWDYYNNTWSWDNTQLTPNTVNTKYFQLTNPSAVVKRAFLYKGAIRIKDTAWGDNITIQVVDKDNVLGYGAGTVLKEFINNDLEGGDIVLPINPPPAPDGSPSMSKVLELFYFKIILTSTDASSVLKMIANIEYEWK